MWDFYIEGVSHEYNFGGVTSTRLTLARGLPHYVYDDAALLMSTLKGTTIRTNGNYEREVSQTGLTGISPQNFAQQIISTNRLYVTPQATVPPASG